MDYLALMKWLIPGVILLGLIGYGVAEHEEVLTLQMKLAKAQESAQIIQTKSEALLKETIARNAELKAEGEKNAQDIAEAYANTVSKISGNAGITCYRGHTSRVRLPAPGPIPEGDKRTMPGSGSTPSGSYGASPDTLATQSLPRDCALTTAQVIGLQRFIREGCGVPILK